MSVNIYCITSPDSKKFINEVMAKLEGGDDFVAHPLFDWKNTPDQEECTDYEALRKSDYVIADLDCNTYTLLEFLAIAAYLKKPVIGTWGLQEVPPPNQFTRNMVILPYSSVSRLLISGLLKSMVSWNQWH